MIKKKEIEALPVLRVKVDGEKHYIGRIRMAGDAIVMDVYDTCEYYTRKEERDAKIKVRWACDKKNFYTYLFRKKVWSEQGMYYALYGYSGYCSRIDIDLDEESEKIANNFLQKYKNEYWMKDRRGAADRLIKLEDDIRTEKRERKEQARKERIEKRVSQRKPLPKDWEKWLRTVFADKRYLFYDAEKRKKGTCACCGAEVVLNGKQKHNTTGKCPACGSRIKYKAKKRTPKEYDEKQMIYLQKTENGFMARYIKVIKISTPTGETYVNKERAMETYTGNKIWRDYNISTVDECWVDNRPSEFSCWSPEGYLYTRNVKKTLEGTPYKYAPLAEWARKKGEILVGNYLKKFRERPFLEFFIKAGLYNLTEEYIGYGLKYDNIEITGIDRKGRTPQEILGINKQRINRLIRIDGGIRTLAWLQMEENKGRSIPDDCLKWLQDNQVAERRCIDILTELGSVPRMINYFKKQKEEPQAIADIWADYMRMAKEAGLDTTDDIVRLPKDLRARHDELVELRAKRTDEERLRKEKEKYGALDRRIMEHLPDVKHYYWETKDYIIIPAGKCEELMEEGRKLHHCVGSSDTYMQRMAQGRSWICFLRKKENVETPYYTLEVDMHTGEVIQWYSEFDRKPDKKVIGSLIRKYEKHIESRKIPEKIRLAATA